MIDPLKPARDHLAVARESLRAEARARELVGRILAVERQLDPTREDWRGDRAGADTELRAILEQLKALKVPRRSPHAAAPPGAAEAIGQLVKALGKMWGPGRPPVGE